MSKKTFVCGTINSYRQTVSKYAKNGESFQTISSGMTRRIVLPNGAKMRFFGTEARGQIVDGAFLVQMVQREIDDYIAKKGTPQHRVVHDVQMFNLPMIKHRLANRPQPVIGIDINACYWNTAHQLGYISDELHARGLSTAKKKGLLISIGCLNKKPVIKTYRDGKLVSTRFDEEFYSRYSPFYWNIITATQDIMMKSYEQFNQQWYMFLTDCLFVDPKVMKDAQKFLTDMGYSSKIHQIEFKKYDGYKLHWHDYKEDKGKVMYVGNRDMQVIYNDWKQKKESA
jgi:hypothetical protein